MSVTRVIPNTMTRTLLSVIAMSGWLTIAAGVIVGGYWMYKDLFLYCDPYFQSSCGQTGFITWRAAIALIVIGAIVGCTAYGRRRYWFDQVLEGTVIDHSWYSGEYGDTYYLVIEGQNRVGETIVGSRSVQPKTYYEFEVGDEITFR